ncbi:MAG: FGGY-family carbohydrate kinase, partial [Mycobacteriales bacterium]
VDEHGAELGYAYREYSIVQEHPGWSEHDPREYWSACCELSAEVLGKAGLRARAISGIAVSSALPSMVLVDDRGEPLAPAINLMDRRAGDEVALVEDTLGADEVFRLSGNRLEDHPSIVNLLWYRRHRPAVLDKTHQALTIDGYIARRLTGESVVNVSAGVFYGVAFDIRRGEFDASVLERLGLERDILPQVRTCTEVIGEVTSAAADQTGLAAGTPVAAGQVDCNASWIAGGAIDAGDMQLNLGTCGVLGVVHDDQDFLGSVTASEMINIPYTTDPSTTFAAVAATTTGGQALRYVRDTFGTLERETQRALGVGAYDLLTLQARDIPPGSEGLIVLPYLMGERSPIWDPAARGVIMGLSLHHTRGHVIRAVLEGVAYALQDNYDKLAAGGLAANLPLVCNEGGARSDIWRRIVTDVLGIPTALLTGAAGAPYGDAVLAGVATGVFDDFRIAKERASTSAVMEPDAEHHERYLEYFEVFRDMYRHLKPDFSRLASIVHSEYSAGSS